MEEKSIITNERRFYPLLVSSNGLEPQADAESLAVWDQLSKVPEYNKKVLLSASIIENLYAAEQKFLWPPYCSARLAYFIRELFFQNISQTEFYKAVEGLLLPQYQNQFNEILSYINNTILTSKPDPEETEELEELPTNRENVKQYVLLEALSKYPNLGNQFITTENIKLKSQVAPVRPTLSNWLKNYRDEIGIGKHDAVARAKFLFETLNTKKLPSQERERIHALIRSLEDNELLEIDVKKQEIVFLYEEGREENEDIAPARTSTPQSTTPVPDLFERFQNQSQPEELRNVGTQTFTQASAAQTPSKPTEEFPKSVREGKSPEAEAVLSRIKNMLTRPVQANAPAPKEDFFQAPARDPQPKAEEALGTLRFSAKHVLPAERQNQSTVSKDAVLPASRLAHFRPQPVAIPEERHVSAPAPQPPKAPESQYPRLAPQTKELAFKIVTPPATPLTQQPLPPVAPLPASAPVPQVKKEIPETQTSIFRIKPNRD